MKQKTAIRQFIERIEKLKWDDISTSTVIELAEDLEPVNEQQIKDAAAECSAFGGEQAIKIGERYFNETFEKP